jgi:hypothetical protein
MKRSAVAASLVFVALSMSSPTRVKAEELPLALAGAVAAFQEMIAYVLSWDSVVQEKDFCIGLEVAFQLNVPKLADLPEAALELLKSNVNGRANLHQASRCTVLRHGFATFNGGAATLLTYWDIDTDIAETLRYRGTNVPELPVRLSFEPNRMSPIPVDPGFAPNVRRDGRMEWDGFGQVGDACGPRYFDFAGDENNVRILKIFQHPQIC